MQRALLVVLVLTAFAAGCQEATPGAGDDAAAEASEGREPAPAFTLEDLSGNPVSLADLRGNTVVLDFWATWCPPCEFQIPILNEVQRSQEGKPVRIFGISIDTGGLDEVRAYLEKHPAEYPILMGTESLAREFGAQGFPTLVIVDAEGRIAQLHVGLIEAADLEGFIAEVAGTAPQA